MTQATSLAKQSDDQRKFLLDRKEKLLALLPKQIGADRFMSLILSIISRPEIASCTPTSILDCSFGCARLGLVPDPIMGHIYIIPRNCKVGYGQNAQWEKQATLQLGYKGLIELGRRSGAIRSVTTEVVYAGDDFKYWVDEHGKHIKHVPYLDRDETSAPIAVYAVAEMSGDTSPQIEVMPWSLVKKIRQRYADEKSKAWNDPLGEIEMAKKTAVRRSSKLWPQSAELARAVLWDEQQERGEMQTVQEQEQPEVITPESPKKRSLLAPEKQLPGDDKQPVIDEPEQPEPHAASSADQMQAEMEQAFSPDEPSDADLAESAKRDAAREASGNMFPPEPHSRPTRTR